MTAPPSWSGCCNCDSSVQMGEVLYEERVYPAGYWACVTRGEALYEQSISMGFMKLMRFICKENSAGQIAPCQHPPNAAHSLIPQFHPPCVPCLSQPVLSVQVGSWE